MQFAGKGSFIMKMTGKCSLGQQIGDRGFYAKITLELDDKPQDEPSRLIDAVYMCRPGVLLGIELARKATAEVVDLSMISIKVIHFHGMVCDTTIDTVAYVTFHAILDALKLEYLGGKFALDTITGQFSKDC
jgi:hypothetical protein